MSDQKRPILVLLTSHWLTMLGVALVTTAGFSWLFAVLPTQVRGHTDNPYIGIIVTVSVFHPGYGLAQGVGGSVTDFNSGTEMLPVNAAKIPAAREHRQSGLRLCISGIVLEVEKHAKLDCLELLAPMALFTGETGGNQTVACDGRLNRVLDTVENNVYELAGASHLALHPAHGAGGNVAIDAFNAGMSRVPMRGEFGFHNVASLPAELGRLHMLYSTVSALRSDDDVNCSG